MNGTKHSQMLPRRAGLFWSAMGLVLIATSGLSSSWAAEIRLRPEARPIRVVVTLGDVAEVLAADPQQAQALSAVELLPTPPPGSQRYLGVRELQDLLLLRGVNLVEHRFSGPVQVTILSRSAGQEPAEPKAVSSTLLERAERIVSEAVVRHLKEHAASAEAWQVDVKLNDDQARLLAAAREVSASGGREPWVGTQGFEVAVVSAGQPARIPVTAQVSVSPAVVVAVQPIAPGAVISAADVTLVRGRPAEATDGAFTAIEDVVGQQAKRLIPADQVVDRGAVRAPVLVRRGEVVTVYSRRPGIQVKLVARAREEGSLGQLVAVESLADRKSYFARVCGMSETEVDAEGKRGQSPFVQSTLRAVPANGDCPLFPGGADRLVMPAGAGVGDQGRIWR